MFYFMLCVYGAVIGIFLIKKTSPPKILLYSAAGFAALMGLSYITDAAGLQFPVNFFTAASSMLGGLPALILLVILQVVFR